MKFDTYIGEMSINGWVLTANNIEVTVNIDHDSNYGADADGRRGWPVDFYNVTDIKYDLKDVEVISGNWSTEPPTTSQVINEIADYIRENIEMLCEEEGR